MSLYSHTIAAGETLAQIIDHYHITQTDTLFNCPENQPLWAITPDAESLPAGKTLFIPVSIINGHTLDPQQDNVFYIRSEPAQAVKFQLKMKSGEVLPNLNFTFETELESRQSTTDSEGWVNLQLNSPAEAGLITCYPHPNSPTTAVHFAVILNLAPAETSEGQCQRLTHAQCYQAPNQLNNEPSSDEVKAKTDQAQAEQTVTDEAMRHFEWINNTNQNKTSEYF